MINLIRNEFQKLLYRPFILFPFVLCLGCFVLFFFWHFQNQKDIPIDYTTEENIASIMTLIEEEQGENFPYEINKYEYILKEHLLIPIQGWQMSALNEAFLRYKKDLTEEELTPHETASSYRYFKLLCEAVDSESSNDYLQLQLEQLQSDPDLTAIEKYHYNLYYTYLINQNIEPDTGDWRQDAAVDLLESRLALAELDQASDTENSSYDDSWQEAYSKQAVAEYRLEQNIPLLITSTDFGDSIFWKSLFDSKVLLPLIQIPIILFLSGMISDEISHGRLGIFFAQPVSRQNYFIAKWLTAMICCTLWILFVYLWNILTAAFLFGTEDLKASTLFVRDGMVNAYPALFLLLKHYLLSCFSLYVTGAFCLFLSSILTHTLPVNLFAVLGFVFSQWGSLHFTASNPEHTSGSMWTCFLLFILFLFFSLMANVCFCKKQL